MESMDRSMFQSVEMFRNYTASEVFTHGLAAVSSQQKVEDMMISQKQMLQRFEKTNEMLINCNHLSSTRFQSACSSFKQHNQVLTELKKDLDYIFKKLKKVKTKLSTTYPKEFENAMASALALNEEEEEDLATTEDQQEGVEGTSKEESDQIALET
ncbi:kxDL motif-containing protein CG10681-like isoform X2 [Artemia franciscana]